MVSPDMGIKTRAVKADTRLNGQRSIRNNSPQLDLPVIKSSSVVEDLHKSRRELGCYKDSGRDSESAKARAEVELSEAKKLLEELTLQIEKSNHGTELLKRDMEALKIDINVEENGDYVEVLKDLEAVKYEVSRLKLDVSSILGERSAAEKEIEELWFKMEENLRLLESLKNNIEVANEEHFLVELGKIETLMEYKEIEREREVKGKENLDLLVEKKMRIKEMLEDLEKLKNVENELYETASDIEMLETQLKLVKKMERREDSMSKSNRSFDRGSKYSLSVLKEVTESTESKKEELASVNAELFQLMKVMNALRNEVVKAKEVEEIIRKYDIKIQKLNSKMLVAKSKHEVALSNKERVSSLADNLVDSLKKLKRNREASKKEEYLLKEQKTVTKAETERTKLDIDEKERELISMLDELGKAKKAEALVLEKLESLIEETMESREMECKSTITISRFEYEYLSRHGSQAEETAEKKVVAAEAWVEALKASTKAVMMKTESLMRESGMKRVEEEREAVKMERSLSMKRLVEGEIEKIKPVQRGKPRRYSSAGTPTFFVIKKKKKVPILVKFFGRRR